MDMSGNALRAAIARPISGNKLRRPETDFARNRCVCSFFYILCCFYYVRLFRCCGADFFEQLNANHTIHTFSSHSVKLFYVFLPFLSHSKQVDSNPRYKYDNIMATELDMPEKNTQEFSGAGKTQFDCF